MKKYLSCLLYRQYRQSIRIPQPINQPIQHDHADHVSFFIVAHADDIELFIGREAQKQILDQERKKVFIVLTAGDSGHKNTKKFYRPIPWWLAREYAHINAISYWNQHQHPIYTQTIEINHKKINRVYIGNHIVLYHFRLPDGDPITSFETLCTVKDSVMYDIIKQQAFDQSTVINCLQHLFEIELSHAHSVQFHVTDWDAQRNPNDHADHQALSKLIVDLFPHIQIKNKTLFSYLSYSIQNRPINLNDHEKEMSFSTWKLMGDILESYGYKRNDDHEHQSWLGKEYPNLIIDSDFQTHFLLD